MSLENFFGRSDQEYKDALANPMRVLYEGCGQEFDEQSSIELEKFVRADFDSEQTLKEKADKVRELQEQIDQWSDEVAFKRGIAEQEIKNLRARLLEFGSYSLGVSSKEGDIDLVCVASHIVGRETDFYTDLKIRLEGMKEMKNCTLRRSAKVPIITFTYKGQSMDLSLARLSKQIVPQDIDTNIPDDYLRGMDEIDRLSIGGRRDNMELLKLVGRQMEVFRSAVKVIKLWTKRKGVHENKLGFFGGISYALMTAKICQLFPKFPLTKILEMFFAIYSRWDWKTPIRINEYSQDNTHPLYEEQYNLKEKKRESKIIILTPTFPCYNTMKSQETNRQVIQLMLQESNDLIQTEVKTAKNSWKTLLLPYPFFDHYKQFIEIDILGTNEREYDDWKTICLIKMLTLFKDLEEVMASDGHNIFLHPFPNSFQKRDEDYKEFSEAFFIALKRSGEIAPPNKGYHNKKVRLRDKFRNFVMATQQKYRNDNASHQEEESFSLKNNLRIIQTWVSELNDIEFGDIAPKVHRIRKRTDETNNNGLNDGDIELIKKQKKLSDQPIMPLNVQSTSTPDIFSNNTNAQQRIDIATVAINIAPNSSNPTQSEILAKNVVEEYNFDEAEDLLN